MLSAAVYSQTAGGLGVLAGQVDLGRSPTTSTKRGIEELDYMFIILGNPTSEHPSCLRKNVTTDGRQSSTFY